MARVQSRAEKIRALELKKAKAKLEIKQIEEDLKPLLIEAFQEETGIAPGVLVMGRVFGHERVFRVTELIVTSYGAVKPKGKQLSPEGKEFHFAQSIWGECRITDEAEALKHIRAIAAKDAE